MMILVELAAIALQIAAIVLTPFVWWRAIKVIREVRE